MIGPDREDQRAPTVAIDTRRPPEELAHALGERGILTGWGHFYAPRILRRVGLDPQRGVLRLSFVHYTSEDDVRALIEALDAVL